MQCVFLPLLLHLKAFVCYVFEDLFLSPRQRSVPCTQLSSRLPQVPIWRPLHLPRRLPFGRQISPLLRRYFSSLAVLLPSLTFLVVAEYLVWIASVVFRLSLADVNECREFGHCDQRCDNRRPGFRCRCVGPCFQLKMVGGPGVDNSSSPRGYCVSKEKGKARLFFTKRDKMYSIDPNAADPKTTAKVVAEGKFLYGVDFDYADGKVFFLFFCPAR